MYTDQDLDAAVSAGVLERSSIEAFRTYIEESRPPHIDDAGVGEEQFRLITGFNDIFVVIASALVLSAVGWIGLLASETVSSAALAAAAWALAEYFTRVRRMALPSIVLLLVFVAATFWLAAGLANLGSLNSIAPTLPLATGAAAAAFGAWLHWRRFRVPITVAAGTTALAGGLLLILISWVPSQPVVLHSGVFCVGLAVFAVAMRWDLSDPLRRTRNSDVAFWLHLAAAPLLVQPVFALVSLLGQASDLVEALLVVAVYFVIGAVALAIDRRALLVSALAFLLSALGGLFQVLGAVSPNFALAALIVGAALLLLSAFWDAARRLALRQLPPHWQSRLPPLRDPDAVGPA